MTTRWRDAMGGTEQLSDHDFDTVTAEFEIPAEVEYVSVLRTTAVSFAARLGCTIDEVEDLRIAVHEAAAMLIELADPKSRLSCRFQLDNQLLVALSVPAGARPMPADTSFAWQILRSLTKAVEVDHSEPRRLGLRLLTGRDS
ncbi:ATP-binding protein [Tenggerimyces flavus]|uniref:ATP-binding protein n=1 Tax=Tenggerimyces flavus TaxID=1708749 RepID=A0ABV7YGD1_9ACTN|nr:ATP-binding protein [Tenggerimyces flavus]MBM7784012.1 serine/threonine-protein kinase RsbW [Tenggerimyces flavus]